MEIDQQYKLKRAKSFPSKSNLTIQSGYIPVSMNNIHFKSDYSIKQILKWTAERTPNVTFVVGDYLHRNNLIFINNLSESDAIIESLKMGDNCIETIRRANNDNYNITFIRTESFYQEKNFELRMKRLLKELDVNNYFKMLVEETINVFLDRQKSVISDSQKARFYCQRYLLEEIIIFELMSERGFVENIYPGKQLKIMKEIIRGNLGGISEPILKSTLIELIFLKQSYFPIQNLDS